MTHDEIVDLIVRSVREVLTDIDQVRGRAVNETSELIGPAGLLDSMGLVTAVVEIEQRIEERHGVSVTLADERALSAQKSPFRTVESLAEHVSRQVSGAGRVA